MIAILMDDQDGVVAICCLLHRGECIEAACGFDQHHKRNENSTEKGKKKLLCVGERYCRLLSGVICLQQCHLCY